MISPGSKDTKMACHCRLPAVLHISNTVRNPSRLFYTCCKASGQQCSFFHWSDEPALVGDRNIDELNLLRQKCILLEEKLEKVEQERRKEKRMVQRRRNKMKAKLSAAEVELADIKKRIELANDSDLMPPLDRHCAADLEADHAKSHSYCVDRGMA